MHLFSFATIKLLTLNYVPYVAGLALTFFSWRRVLETLKRVYLGPRRNYDLAVAFNERGADFNFKDVLKIAEI